MSVPRPRREQFILDVRQAAKSLHAPNVEADSEAADTDAIVRILHRAKQWLTPTIVNRFDPLDFDDSEKGRRERLSVAVAGFREIADRVSSGDPVTVDLFTAGTERLRELAEALGGIVRDEWLGAIDALESLAEEWCGEETWQTRRVKKPMNESLLGPYEATQLLIFAAPNLYVLDPVARFVPGARGAFDFTIQPSYNSTSLYRDDDGCWYIHPGMGHETANGRRIAWNKEGFLREIHQLGAMV